MPEADSAEPQNSSNVDRPRRSQGSINRSFERFLFGGRSIDIRLDHHGISPEEYAHIIAQESGPIDPQKFGRLVSVSHLDPITGEVIWTRVPQDPEVKP